MTEHRLNLIISSRSAPLDDTNFSNSVSSSGTCKGPLIEKGTKFGEIEVILEGGTIIKSTVTKITGSSPGYTRE